MCYKHVDVYTLHGPMAGLACIGSRHYVIREHRESILGNFIAHSYAYHRSLTSSSVLYDCIVIAYVQHMHVLITNINRLRAHTLIQSDWLSCMV